MRKIFLIVISVLLILSLASCREKNQNSVDDNSNGITDSTEQGNGEKNEGETEDGGSSDGEGSVGDENEGGTDNGNLSDDEISVGGSIGDSGSDGGDDTTVDLPIDEFE